MVNKVINKKQHTRKTHEKILPELISAALLNDITSVQSISFAIARSIKSDDPDLAKLITDVVGNFSVSKNPMRAMGMSPVPTDVESYLEIASLTMPTEILQVPVLSKEVEYEVTNFIKEWENQKLLLSKNIKPSTSMLLVGDPGTGKTMTAKYVASKLNLNLLTLDLSISMSSLLGKTGQNIKRVFNYARKNPCVLLLDEFDAIAKRRDDPSDLGEMKRVVNVLLLELENWPATSILIATSNHPELLDRAIWRRFDKVVQVNNPDFDARNQIILNNLDFYGLKLDQLDANLVLVAAKILENKNASDLSKFSERIIRRTVLDGSGFQDALLLELENFANAKKVRGQFCIEMREIFGDAVSVRQLSKITGLSISGVQHHLKNIN